MKFLTFLGALLIALSCASFAEPKYLLDNSHALVRFTVKMAGMSEVEGRFAENNAAITYNEADLAKSSVTALIRVTSIDTAEKERDQHLCSPDFFDAAKYPVIRFVSKRIEKRGDAWVAVGDLTMHGVTKEVELPFQWTQKKHTDPFGNDRVGFEARTTIKRSDFGINGPKFWGKVISDDVDILMRISARIYNWDHIDPRAKAGKKSLIAELLPLFEKGDPMAARRLAEIQKAGTSEYDLAEWHYHVLGSKLYQHGKTREALEVFKAFAEAYPKSSTALDDLGDAYEATGDKNRAHELFKKSAELDPFNAEAAENLRTITN